MKSDLYATLRERIVRHVPEIMELKFGCKYWVKTRRTEKPFIILHDSDVHTAKALLDIEILGRDIQLHDVMRAMDAVGPWNKWQYVNTKGWFSPTDNVHYGKVQWNLALPLHEQSDEFGQFLLTVIE